MDRAEKAIYLRSEKKYNCCQVVLAGLEDLSGMDRVTALRCGAGFGGGMGCMEATCGALIGAALAYSYKTGTATVDHPEKKSDIQKQTAAMLSGFMRTAGAVRCKDLKGIESGKMLYSCPDCVRLAVRIGEQHLLPLAPDTSAE